MRYYVTYKQFVPVLNLYVFSLFSKHILIFGIWGCWKNIADGSLYFKLPYVSETCCSLTKSWLRNLITHCLIYKYFCCLIVDRKEAGFTKNMGKYIAHGIRKKHILSCFDPFLKTFTFSAVFGRFWRFLLHLRFAYFLTDFGDFISFEKLPTQIFINL